MSKNGDGPTVPMRVPILGRPMVVGKGRSGGQVAGIARKLDAAGMFEVDIVQGPDGQPVPSTRRESFMDAEELLAAIEASVRRVMREELAALKEA